MTQRWNKMAIKSIDGVPFVATEPVPDPFAEQVGGEHYKGMAIQPIEYILANNLGFPEGTVVKYVSRWQEKGGVEDLRKACHILEMLIAHTEGKEDQP